MKTLMIIISAISLTSCVKVSEFDPCRELNTKQKIESVSFININDTLYTSPEAYAVSHGEKIEIIVLK